MQSTHIRNVHAQIFTGRGHITNINVSCSGSYLQTLLDQPLPLLRADDVLIQNGEISTLNTQWAVGPAQQAVHHKFMTDLCLQPQFQNRDHPPGPSQHRQRAVCGRWA